jgi:serine/threonine-protein kinase HipA
MCSNSEKVEKLIGNSFLSEKLKRNYLQAYQSRLKKLMKE